MNYKSWHLFRTGQTKPAEQRNCDFSPKKLFLQDSPEDSGLMIPGILLPFNSGWHQVMLVPLRKGGVIVTHRVDLDESDADCEVRSLGGFYPAEDGVHDLWDDPPGASSWRKSTPHGPGLACTVCQR